MASAGLSHPVVDLDAVGVPLSAPALFGRDCPMELEIGVGKGRFLLEWAQQRPDLGLLGVERARKYLTLAAQRAAKLGLVNVRLVHTTAEDVLFRCLSDGSLAAVHVYFSDPWPKKRHHKRRLFRAETVRRMADVLSPGAPLLVKTDHAAYAAVIGELLQAETRLAPLDQDAAFEDIPPTSFEIKYSREERPVHRFACRRTGGG